MTQTVEEEDEVHTFLQHFELSQYESALREQGLENIKIIHELEDQEIDELATDANLKDSDIGIFKKAIHSVKNGTYNENKQQEEFKYEYKTIEFDQEEINKTIIFIGESGTGKTTTINSLCNYLFDVKYNDKFRYKLIDEIENKNDETQSQTRNINKYYLRSKDLSKIDYSLTIIDTPGFGNTESIKNDIFITQKFKKCFEKHKFIDAIYFVVKATDTKVSDIQRYIIKKLLNLFDESFEENIFVLYTFSDGSDPPAVKAVEKLNIKYNTYFKMNNSGFTFPDRNNNNNTHKMYFNLGIQQFDEIFSELNNTKPQPTKQIVENLIRHKNRNNEQGAMDMKEEENVWIDAEYWKLDLYWYCGYIKESKHSKEILEAFKRLEAYNEQIGPFSSKSSGWIWNNKSTNNKTYEYKFANILQHISTELVTPLREILNNDLKNADKKKQKYIRHKLQYDYCKSEMNRLQHKNQNKSNKRRKELPKCEKKMENAKKQLIQSVKNVERKVMLYVNNFATFVQKWKSESDEQEWTHVINNEQV